MTEDGVAAEREMMPGDLIHDDAGLERAIDRQVASFRHTISTERIYRHALSR